MSGDLLDPIRAALPGALIAVDYDGSLAPIVNDPASAFPAPGAGELLIDLASRVGTLAIITGRASQTVVALGGLHQVPGLVAIGHYGLQRWEAGVLSTPAALPGIESARPRVGALLPPGGFLEDKEHSLVLHVRNTGDPEFEFEALAAPVAALADELGLEAVAGRYVWELRPPGVDKGQALALLAAQRHPTAVLVAGDDLGDLPMFAAARTLGIPAVCVAVNGADGPAQVASAADLVVEEPAGLLVLLRSLWPPAG